MFSSARKTLIGILVACVAIILSGCGLGECYCKFTVKNTSSYPVTYYLVISSDDEKEIVLQGNEKTTTHQWMEGDIQTEWFKYTIKGEIVERYDIPLHHKEHITVIIKAPGQDGFEILRETDIEL